MLMVNVGWCKCNRCGYEQRTSAKIGNRIKCRRESCQKTFKVKLKLKHRLDVPDFKGNYSGTTLYKFDW